ncbi:receptor kinase-like protein Xa21 [Asparagus officinalis]|uniref:receptor kinase-like protein Xa21 n=1 Tax=Asparagus officinalis TaxID=4686 RepID=UPI00098E2856|nr:receptor kinase-like protein Xa21 [Asparagus officinalis]
MDPSSASGSSSSRGPASFSTQADALLRKNLIFQKRNTKTNACIISYPLVLCIIIVIIQVIVNKELDKPKNRCGCKCIPTNSSGRCEEVCGIQYSDAIQAETCAVPSPPRWPALMQVPRPEYRAVRSGSVWAQDFPDRSCRMTGSCPATLLYTGKNKSLAESLAGNFLPEISSLNFSDYLNALSNIIPGTDAPTSLTEFIENAFVSDRPLYVLQPRCSGDSVVSLDIEVSGIDLQQDMIYDMVYMVYLENDVQHIPIGNFETEFLVYLSHVGLGSIPSSIANLTSLTELYLYNNSLSGSIPSSIANLTSLTVLSLYNNELTGSIPPSIGNLFSLTYLALDLNRLSGSIPHSLGRLSELRALDLFGNNLSEVVPSSLWNLSSLSFLDMSYNYHLSGSLPPNIGQALPLLETFYLPFNQFHGPIPMSLSNASRLQNIDLSGNSFSGVIPPSLGRLRELQSLILYSNHLETMTPDGWNFLTALTNCTQLEWLTLASNKLRGVLPNSIANLSTNIQFLYMQNNFISGTISSDIGNLVNLMVLRMNGNSLYGSIPSSIGMLQKLHELYLYRNKLSGEIPSTIGNLTQLNELYLDSNELSGNIPVSLGKCQNLIYLNLGSNKLTGNIPKEIVSISGLSIYLSLASNALSGPIPSEIGSLINVNILDFSMNKLSGEIPITLSKCQVLEELYIGGNLFQGSIPSFLASLRGIQKLDFSKNNLSGKIPDFLQDFHGLDYLNLSFNNFEGEVPLLGVFANASAVSVIGNSKLCGGNPGMHLPACPSEPINKKHHSHTVMVICGSTILFIFVILLFCFLVVRCRRKGSRRKSLDSSPTIEQNVKVTYGDLVRATDGFSEENIIGTGSFGTVYKGLLDGESRKIVAVKVLNLQIQGASRTFIAECEAVKNIRHRNLLKILTVCSSVDFKGNDFKAVVFEFIENGSLDDWLHPKANEQSKPKKLDLTARLDIAIDVAYALRLSPPSMCANQLFHLI